MHKSPVGERFIIASPKCYLKPLLKDATSILKLFQKQIQAYNDKERIWKVILGYSEQPTSNWSYKQNWYQKESRYY